MNYAGKFGSGGLDPYSSVDLGQAFQNGHLFPDGKFHVDKVSTHAPSDAIIVPDAHLLFTGDFKRSGVDLILSAGERELVLHDYFKGEKRAPLASPDGAHLTGDLVNALSGYTQFAQADGSASVAPAIIGSVTKLTGNATAIRNGVSIILNQGDNVHKGDVVQSGSDSTLGITFIDGTVFGLASNAKMVLNEMIYDPNGSDNKSLLSLVAGTISFVAGATAKKGDMKVDTPVATMGIRGTAVLVEIDFEVPSQGGAPPAKFQVLVEPDGTTGSYILFDKTTLTPIATVNRAGTQTIINGQGGVSFQSSVQLSPDAQKIITDVFSLKFSDLNNPNTKLTTNFTDSIVPETLFVKLASNEFIPVSIQLLNIPTGPAPTPDPGPTDKPAHIPGPPTAKAFGGAFAERSDITGSAVADSVSGVVNYVDINAGDVPSVSVLFSSFNYQNAQQADVSATLTAEQLAAIQAVEVPVTVVQDPNGKNYGSATWTYTLADGAFDFLAAGEKLTLTYMARVDNNYAPNNETTFTPFTIEITGTNDKPTIATGGGSVVELTGSGNTEFDTVSGTVVFTDADLTDRPIVSAALSSTQPFKYLDADGNDITETLTPQQLAAIAAVEVQLSVVQNPGNTHNGTATWTYSVPDSAFDFIADDETLILNYVVQVDDGHGGIISTPVTVSINGADVSVTGTNDVPIIVDDSTTATDSMTEDEAATLAAGGTITFQDLDLTDTHAATFVLKSSNANANLPGYSETAPLGAIGTFSLTAVSESPGITNVGSIGWSFSLNNNDPVLQSLAVGQTITQVYTVTFDDHHGGTVTQDVTVTITGTNDAPTIVAGLTTASGAVTEDIDVDAGEIETSGTIAIQDVDLIDTHTAIWEFKSSASNEHLPGFDEGSTYIGTFTIDSSVTESISDIDNGATLGWSFTLGDDHAVLQSLALGQTITQVYTVTFNDHHGGTVTQDVTVTITGTNDAPTVTSNAAAASGAVIEDASTPTLSTGGTIAIQDVDLIDTHTAIWEFKSSASNEHLPGFDEGSTNIGTFTIDSSVTESTSDIDNGATLGWSFTLNNDDAVLQSLALGQTITQVYAVTFDDHNGGTVTQDVTVTITGTNDAPEIDAIAATKLDEKTDTSDLTATIGVTFTDLDLTDIGHAATITDVEADGDTAGLGLSNADLIALVKAGIPTKDADSSARSVDLDFSAASTAFDYLAENEFVTLTYTVEISDGDGGTTSQDFTITIDGTNDAPVLTASSPSLADITEDETANTGQTVASFLGTGIADVDHGALQGIAITGTTSAHGHWEYSTDGSSFAAFPAVSTGSALLLAATDWVRFVPDGEEGGTDTFTYAAWDQTTGTHGTTADVSASGGSTAFSATSDTATLTVTAINDAPTATAPAANYSATAETDLSLRNTGLSVADVDGGSSIETVTLAVGEGIITITAGDSGVTNIIGSGTGSVTFSGTVAQINALLNTSTGTVIYNDNAAAPSATTTLTLTVQDNGNLTDSASTTIEVTPTAESSSIQLVAESFLGGAGDQTATDVSYANSHLYLTYNAAVTQTASDQSTIVTFATGASGATQDFSYQWDYGFFNGVAADADTIYAVGAGHPTDGGLTQDNAGGQEVKSILVSFNADGTAGSNPAPATGYTPNSFFGYGGVEMFEDVLVTTQGGNTLLYAVGFGQPSSYGAYIIAEYNSSGQLVNLAADSMSVPSFSIANDAVEFNGGIWAVGNSWNPNAGDSTNVATVWQANYSLSSVVAHQVDTGSVGANFASAAVLDNALYAVGNVTSNGGDYLIAKYNSDGSVAWSTTFGGTGADMLNGVVALDGHLYVVGSTEDGGNTDGVLMEIDTTDGSIVSTTTYGGELYDSFNSITTDGNYLYVAGETKSYTNGGNGAGEADAVLVTYAPFSGPVIGTDAFTVTENGDGTTTVSGLYFTDTDATAATDTFNIATDADDPNSVVTPSDESGTFADINDTLSTVGITYDPDDDLPPDTDMVTLTVTDGFGHTDTVNFIFNEAGMDGLDTTLLATSGKDVIFSTGDNDTLTGGDGADQFVFSLEGGDNYDTITDFTQDVDHIDLRAFSEFVDSESITDWLSDPDHVTTSGTDKHINLGNGDTIILQGLAAANLQTSDFIVSPH